jgi:hypothetical protein
MNNNSANVLPFAVAVLFSISLVTQAASRVSFDNQSGRPALVKIAGPTVTSVSVDKGKKKSVSVASGHYYIKVRYGTPGTYSYSKGDQFDVTETATVASEITITLHKVIAGNNGSNSISEAEFSSDEFKPPTSSPAIEKTDGVATATPKPSLRWANILLEVVSKDQNDMFKLLFKIRAGSGQTLSPTTFIAMNLEGLPGFTKVSIRDIINKYGEPTARKTMTKAQSEGQLDLDLDVYDFDNAVLLTCRPGSTDVHGVLLPELSFMVGLREIAQRALAEAK